MCIRSTTVTDISHSDAEAILERARLLRHGTGHGDHARPPLIGKNVALMSESDDGQDAALFREAAAQLGARVAQIRPSPFPRPDGDYDAGEVRRTADLLSRLYDLVECQGVAPRLVEKIRFHAAIPIFEGVALESHPLALLAHRLEPSEPMADRRRWLVQALLVGKLG